MLNIFEPKKTMVIQSYDLTSIWCKILILIFLNLKNYLITVWTSVAFLISVISNWWFFTNSMFWTSFTSHFNITIITIWSSFTWNPFSFMLLFTITTSRWFFDLGRYFRFIAVFTFWTVFTMSTVFFTIISFFNTSITIRIGFASRSLTFFISFFITVITVRILMSFTFTIITIYCFTVFTFWISFRILFIIIRKVTIRN